MKRKPPHPYAFAPILKRKGGFAPRRGRAYAELFVVLEDGTKRHIVWFNMLDERKRRVLDLLEP